MTWIRAANRFASAAARPCAIRSLAWGPLPTFPAAARTRGRWLNSARSAERRWCWNMPASRQSAPDRLLQLLLLHDDFINHRSAQLHIRVDRMRRFLGFFAAMNDLLGGILLDRLLHMAYLPAKPS